MPVAFAGEAGAFAEEAVCAIWPSASPMPTRTVPDVLQSVLSGRAEAGVVAVENSVAGGVVAAYDALVAAERIFVVGEVILRVRQYLLGVPGARLADVQLVESHPVALAQCAEFLRTLPRARQVPTSDTATAARTVAEARDRTRAAIASRGAGQRWGLVILAEGIEDRADNQTRFLAVGREPARVPRGQPARTSLVFTTPNQPGALLRVLEPIAQQDLNLSKLESRPTGEPWTYRFFADIDHAAGDDRLTSALIAITNATQTCRVLGTYARAP